MITFWSRCTWPKGHEVWPKLTAITHPTPSARNTLESLSIPDGEGVEGWAHQHVDRIKPVLFVIEIAEQLNIERGIA